MGSLNNFPHQPLIFGDEVWAMANIDYTHMTSDVHTYICSDSFPAIGYTPDARASQTFLQLKASKPTSDPPVINKFGTDEIYYSVDVGSNPNKSDMTVKFYASDGTVLETISLNIKGLTDPVPVFNGYGYDNVTIEKRNFYVRCPNGVANEWGIACAFHGTKGSGEAFHTVSDVLYAPVTNATVKANLEEVTEIRMISNYYGTYSQVLEDTDGFELSQFPEEYFTKEVYSSSHNKFSEFVCRCDGLTVDDVYDQSVAWKVILSQNDYWKDLNNYGLSVKMAQYLQDIGQKLGSDIFRRNADGTFTNGADLSQSNLAVGNTWHQDQVEYEIEFRGGKLQIQSKSYVLQWKVNLTDAQGNVLDSWDIPVANNGTKIGDTNIYYPSVCSLYLAEHNGEYYLFGLQQFRNPVFNDNGVQIKYNNGLGNYYSSACCYQKLYKFSPEGSQVLKNGTATIIENDPEYIPEDSPDASLPEDVTDGYDRSSLWDDGERQGSNDGIRYSGDDNIDASDLEETKADNIPGGQQISEDPNTPGHIPTPINTEMINVFNPSESQMQLFASDLNADNTIQKLTNYFSNPNDIVVSAHTCIAPDLTLAGTDKYIVYGVYKSATKLTCLSQQYYKVYMGWIEIPEVSKGFADYPPYSSYSVYLPYIGTREFDGSVAVGRKIYLNYYIDVITGNLDAELLYKDMKTGKECPIGYYNGNTLVRFPLKSTDYSQMISSAINGVFGTASAFGSAVSGNVFGGVVGGLSTMVGAGMQTLKQAVSPHINLNGTASGSLTYMMYPYPYIIQKSPHFYNKLPLNYTHVTGMPSNTGCTISDVISGTSEYIQFAEVDVDQITNPAGDPATQEEKIEIENLLKQGVWTL